MATRNLTGRGPLGWGRRWAWLLIVALMFPAAWIGGTAGLAQQGPPPLEAPISETVPLPLPPALPGKAESTLPRWNPGQPEPLKQPGEVIKQPEIIKPPTELPKGGKAKPYCPPGSSIYGPSSIAQCDQNVPDIACPSAKDKEQYDQWVKGIVDPKNTLTVYLGRTRLLDLTETPIRIQIGDEKIADIGLFGPAGSPKQISLLGKTLGNTVLNVWFADPADKTKERLIGYLVRVIPDPEVKANLELRYQKLAADINRAFPDSRICLSLVGDKLVVTGQAKDIADATQILRIARSNAPQVDDNKLPYNLSLNLDPGTHRDRVRDLLEVAGPYVINQLRIPGEQNLMVKVTVAEINRSAARSIGLNFSITNKQGIQVFAQNTGNIAGTTTGVGLGGITGIGGVANGFNALNQIANNLPTVLDNGRVVLAVNALKNLNYARTLAEPNITALDGQTASIQAGGEFPIPIVTGAIQVGLQGVEFKPFGVQLSFTPYITERDRVRLTISAAVSTRDLSSGTVINGSLVSGLNTRNFQTVVEMRHGETLAVGGLIQNNLGAQASRVPFFGDLPVIGRAFAFDQLNAGEQELVFLITPCFVHPLSGNEVTDLPGSDLFEPGDLEFYLCGRLESRRQYDYRSPVRTDIHRMLRYHQCEQIYIYGPSGHSEPPVTQAPKGN